MNRQIRHVLSSAAASLVAAFAPLAAHAEWGNLNMPVGVTELSKQIHALHMTIFWWCVAIGVFVFGWMIWSLVAFRKSKGAVADTSITHSTKAEIIWTLIPVVILVIMAIPAARTLIAIEDTKVRLLLTAQDVIHAWWVPQFGMKKDAIPGVVNELRLHANRGQGRHEGRVQGLGRRPENGWH
ncbi:MAG: cytochrome c oxidase subunit II [Acidibacter sp.]|nr:cytochrome c oxidase subunit II [Acidibacter sp.]